MRLETVLGKTARYGIILILSLISLMPILWLISTSFKMEVDAFSIPPAWLFIPTLENYADVLFGRDFARFLFNSVIVTAGTTFLTVAVGAFAAYGLARFRFVGRRVVSTSILLINMIPSVVLVIPLFILWTRFRLTDTRIGLILIYTGINIPFAIWILRSFIIEVPFELEEAALMDGCGNIGIFIRILLPLIMPGVAATAIFVFRIAWNEFLLALILTGIEARTVPVATGIFMTDHGIIWGSITAMGTIVVLPALAFTLLAGRYLVRGLTAGAVKY